jgi:hypothetical protein
VGLHKKGLLVNVTTTIDVKRGSQQDRCQIGVLGMGRVHGKKQNLLKNDRYDYDQGENRNPMGYVSKNGAGRIHVFFFF